MDNLTRELIAEAFSEWGCAKVVTDSGEHHAVIARLLDDGELGERLADYLADALAARDLTLKVIDK